MNPMSRPYKARFCVAPMMDWAEKRQITYIRRDHVQRVHTAVLLLFPFRSYAGHLSSSPACAVVIDRRQVTWKARSYDASQQGFSAFQLRIRGTGVFTPQASAS
jgi:hypothetical protein